ncbi:MAG: site-specific tyrosine recombinase XerC [Kiritimatiellae bacterium]|jgi:integrase/recombinase XerD|nr:site-specific tyrosine recombinase XerC [Kiritimatiellia bacterium]
MAGNKGYAAVPKMRDRDPEQRGGRAAPPLPAGDPFSLSALSESWYQYLAALHRSTEGKKNDLRPFLAWALERDITHPEQVTRSKLESYQRWLYRYRKTNGKPLGISTQRNRITTIKHLFAWMGKQRLIEANPAADLELPRPEHRLPVEALSRSQIEAVLSVPEISDALGLRDRAMLELFYSTGIRRSELARLELSDLNPEKQVLRVRKGKGRKDRVVPVGNRSLHWVSRYLDEVRPLLTRKPDEAALFLTGYGDAFNPEVIGRKVSKFIRQADINRKGGPHLLRHTCATHMLEGGADIRYIQQLLGHAKLETTAIYTHVSIIELQAVHARCHPAENKKPE